MPTCAVTAVSSLWSNVSSSDQITMEYQPFPLSGGRITVPATVAFGERDWILLKRWQRRNELPAHTRWVEKQGWGYALMEVVPVGVWDLILEGTQ